MKNVGNYTKGGIKPKFWIGNIFLGGLICYNISKKGEKMDTLTIVCPHCFKSNRIPKQATYTKANCGHCKQSLLGTVPIELTKTNFGSFLNNNDIPVVVDFWASWCGPCKAFAPTFKSVASEYPLKIRFAKVDVDKEGVVAQKFNIQSIPTLILFKNGKELRRISGALDSVKLKKFIGSA